MGRETKQQLVAEIEAALARDLPDVEVVDLDVDGARARLTLFIDRTGGVDLDLCATVSSSLDEVRERYALEVSSPGLDRRLRTGAHFVAAVGEDVALRLSAPHGGRRNYRGTLVDVGETRVVLALADGATVELDLDDIATAHVVYNFQRNGGRRE